MKKLFIETKYDGDLNLEKIKVKDLPEKIAIVTTVQFVDYLKEIKDYLEQSGKKVMIGKGLQEYPGQVLGCEQSSALELRAVADAYLFVGDGLFHPIGISVKTGKKVFLFNPFSAEFKKLDKKQIENIKMKRKAQLMKFYSSDEIGVIVSTKPGQNKLEEAKKLKKKFPKKNFYFILFDNIDFTQLENFNFIQAWINTACPRIEEDIKVLNLEDIR